MPPTLSDLFLMILHLKDYTWLKVYQISDLKFAYEEEALIPLSFVTSKNIEITDVHYFTLQTLIVRAATMFTTITGVIFIMFAASSKLDKEKSIIKSIPKN